MFLRVYKILGFIVSPLMLLILCVRVFKGKESLSKIDERFGGASIKRPQGKLIWIHAASVGESFSVLPLVRNLSVDPQVSHRILITSGTLTSHKMIMKKFPKSIIYQSFPVENYFVIRKFLKHWKPDLALFMESEFWPCIISETSKFCKVISLNTRISDVSCERWMKFSWFYKDVFKCIHQFIPQSEDTKNKIKQMGYSNVNYIGNLKYSGESLPIDNGQVISISNKIKNRKIILFASTHPGEEKIAIDIYNKLKEEDSSVLMMIAPRHPSRSKEIESLMDRARINAQFRSEEGTSHEKAVNSISKSTQIYIIDTIGELGTFFKVADITIMGGSFVDGIGGHNIIEPAKLNSVVIAGPYMYNFKGICDDFKKSSAALFVNTPHECFRAIKMLWIDSKSYNKYLKNSKDLVMEKNNILPKVSDFIKSYLDKK